MEITIVRQVFSKETPARVNLSNLYMEDSNQFNLSFSRDLLAKLEAHKYLSPRKEIKNTSMHFTMIWQDKCLLFLIRIFLLYKHNHKISKIPYKMLNCKSIQPKQEVIQEAKGIGQESRLNLIQLLNRTRPINS